MLDRIADMTATLAGLLGTKARLVARDLEQAGFLLLACLIAGCCAVIGLVALLGALIALVADHIGTPGALAIAGGISTMLGVGIVGLVWWRARRSARQSREELEREAEAQITRLKGSENGEVPDSVTTEIIEALVGHPSVMASGAFAALAVLGPRRALRLVDDATAAASIAATVSKLIRELDAGRATGEPDGHAPAHASAEAEPDASANGACHPGA